MPRANFTTIEDFSPGYLAKRDFSQCPPGSMILGSQNVVINDGDRIAPRKGSVILGASSTATTPIKSIATFKKRDGSEIMVRSYGTVVEFWHPGTLAWENLNSGYTSGQVFGFASHNINTDATDFLFFCNAIDPYTKWNGAYTQLNGALAGGETTITVDSTLKDQVYYSGTATSVTTTTLTMPAGTWATDLWNGFYVEITDGANAGQIALISATTATEITFATLSGLAGTPTFRIRQLAFDDSNKSIRIGTTNTTWTAVTSTTFTVGSAPAAADNASVTQAVQEYKGNPRGNILKVLNTRMIVGNVKMGGTTAEKGSESSVYYSKIADATDFTFSSPRSPDDGGVVDLPEGGGGVKGIAIQEDVVYIFKEDSIHTLQFTSAGTATELDLPQVRPLLTSPRGGSISSLGVVKVDGEVYYVSPEEGIKSIKRPDVTDFARPAQVSDPIVVLMNQLTTDDAAGIFFKRKAYFSLRSADASTNDTILVWSFEKKCWEAPIVGWNASCWTIYNDALYFGSSINNEVYQCEVTGRYDDNGAPYLSVARFAYGNFGESEYPKSFKSVFLEGYIGESTTVDFTLRYDYAGSQETRTTELSGSDDTIIVSDSPQVGLGLDPLGLNPLAGSYLTSDVLTDLPKFRCYLSTTRQPVYEVSPEFSSDAVGSQWEILRFGYDAEVIKTPRTSRRKKLA